MNNPLILQSDGSILVEVYSPLYEEVREKLAVFAELVRSPEHIHTYKISAVSLWNASAMGIRVEEILETVEKYSKYSVPSHLLDEIRLQMSRYGLLQLLPGTEFLTLKVNNHFIFRQLEADKKLSKYLLKHPDEDCFSVRILHRGEIKQSLIREGFPTQDLAGFTEGDPLPCAFRETTLQNKKFALRDYQRESIDLFYAGGGSEAGHGVIVLPCGAGKTVIGIGSMVRSQTSTLILSTNVSACRQWIREILDKTDLTEDMVGEYSGENKNIKPVTVATYQILTHRPTKDSEFTHFSLFHAANWGLVIYDEVHLLPAPVFRVVGILQAKRRLGLTATLIREDGLQEDVFSLIGPKRYDLPWRELEDKGFIAEAHCFEVRSPLTLEDRLDYASSSDRRKIRIAAENTLKERIVHQLCEHHKEDNILVIGHYIDQLKILAKSLDAPLITGATAHEVREKLFQEFRDGIVKTLVVSRVANFAIDLPDANILIQVSGTFGSRQEEAQRLGRVLRPKEKSAFFYSVITRDTKEQEFSLKRQLFLTEQGYQYQIWNASEEHGLLFEELGLC